MTGGRIISRDLTGITAFSAGTTGNVFVTANTIFSSETGVFVGVSNALNTGIIRVDVNGPITASTEEGVSAGGFGAVTVNVANSIFAGGRGVDAASDGLVTVNQTAGTIQSNGDGIDVGSLESGGVIVKMTGGLIGSSGRSVGGSGISAQGLGTSGDIDIRANSIFSTVDGVYAHIGNADSDGNINIRINSGAVIAVTPGSGFASGVFAQTLGSGYIGITVKGDIDAVKGNDIDAEVINFGFPDSGRGTGSTTINNSVNVTANGVSAGVSLVGGTSNFLSNTGNISENIGVRISGGTTTLANFGTITGTGGTALQIDSGTLQLINGADSLVGNVVDNGLFAINRSEAWTFGGVISGSGGLRQAGNGTTSLTGADTYTGETTVIAGSLALGPGGSISGSSGLDLAAAGAGFDISAAGSQTIQDLSGVSGSTINLGTHTLTAGTANSTTFAGAISGTGALTKTGTGTLILTGANTYTGGTTVGAGTLQGNTLSLQGNIIDSAALVFDQATTGIYGGLLTGTGSLVKQNNGILILNGNSGAFDGTTTVNAGTLVVGDVNNPGASLGSAITVGTAGVLAGHGTIVGSVTNPSGVLIPGGTIGTLTLSGNYTQGTAGALVIEVSPTAASKLVVGGTASLAGTLALVYDPGIYAPRTYTLVQAENITGSFAAVSGQIPSTELSQTVVIDPTDLQLVVAPTNDTIFWRCRAHWSSTGSRRTGCCSTAWARGLAISAAHRSRWDCRRLSQHCWPKRETATSPRSAISHQFFRKRRSNMVAGFVASAALPRQTETRRRQASAPTAAASSSGSTGR